MPHIRQSSNRRRATAWAPEGHGQCFPDGLATPATIGDDPARIELGAAVMGSAPRRGGSNGACGEACREPLRVLAPRNCCMLGAPRQGGRVRQLVRGPGACIGLRCGARCFARTSEQQISIAGPDNGRLSSPAERRVPSLRAAGQLVIVRDALAASTVTNGQIDRRARPLPSDRRRRANHNTYTNLRPG